MLLHHAGQIVNHIRQIGDDLERPLIGLPRGLEIAQFLPHDAQIHMCLLGVGTNANRFAIGFGGLFKMSALLLGDTQVEPALKMIGRKFHQLGAEPASGFVIVSLKCAGGQTFESGLRERTHLQQSFRILLDELDDPCAAMPMVIRFTRHSSEFGLLFEDL